MKKLLFLFTATLLVLTSCSKDDDNSSDSNPATATLVKKIIYTEGTETYSTILNYNGNKIVSAVSSDNYKTNYTYNGDVITKTEDFDDKNVVETTTEYTYANGKLATSFVKESGAPYDVKTVYTYNADGTVSFTDSNFNKTTGALVDDGGRVGKYTYSAGNLVKKAYSYYGTEYTNTFEYDTKNNPVKNITGFSLLLDNEEDFCANNLLKRTSSTSTGIETHTYTYDVNGFPIEQKSFYNGTAYGTAQYQY